MAATGFFDGKIATELLKEQLLHISRKSDLFKSPAGKLICSLQALLPIIDEMKNSDVEPYAVHQLKLDSFFEILRDGINLAAKVVNSGGWKFYKKITYARKLEHLKKLEASLEKLTASLVLDAQQVHFLDIRQIRFVIAQQYDRVDQSIHRMENWLGSLKIGFGVEPGMMEEALRRAEEEDQTIVVEGSLVNVGLEEVKEMVIGTDLGAVGICGIGSGKTTLARDLCRDDKIRSHFKDRVLFVTVSQSPNVEQLRSRIWGFLMGNDNLGPSYVIPEWNLECTWKKSVRALVVLDDVWSLQVLERLIFKVPGCKTLVVSGFKFPTVLDATYEGGFLGDDEALALFCHSAFGQKSIPPNVDENLVKQIVNGCKGFPLAIKVIGASLRDQSEMYWASAKNRLSRGKAIYESYENTLLEPVAICVNMLSDKARECFLDLGAFAEDKKIPLDLLINMWVELRNIDEQEAFAILFELENKNLLTLVKFVRDGDVYPSSCDVAVTQHDVLRDLALHLSSHGNIGDRKRLLMPRMQMGLSEEFERNSDQPFNAQIVSFHTGKMNEMDWFQMEFPKAEVLIINFSSEEYFLPPFMEYMPKLRVLVIINHHSANASLRNFPEFSRLASQRSLWLERVSVPQLSSSAILLSNLKRLCLVRCEINNNFDEAGSASASTSVVPLTDMRLSFSRDRMSLSSDRFSIYTDDIED